MSPLSHGPDHTQLNSVEQKVLSSGELPKERIEATLIGSKIIVFNHFHAYLLYGFGRFFGIPVGIRKPKIEPFERPLELSSIETYYLLIKGIISLKVNDTERPGSHWNESQFWDYAVQTYPHFEERYTIYEDLREKNYIPRPGQKFGADFIVYRRGPGIDHSSFCIQVLPPHSQITSIDVVRSARLATSVKKRFVMANPRTKSYFSFKWFKP